MYDLYCLVFEICFEVFSMNIIPLTQVRTFFLPTMAPICRHNFQNKIVCDHSLLMSDFKNLKLWGMSPCFVQICILIKFFLEVVKTTLPLDQTSP